MAKKKKSKFRYFIIFILFIGIGVGLGIFGTKKYLEYKDEEKTPVVDEGPVEITDNVKYQDLILELSGILNRDPMFYSTKGVIASSLDNTSRLNILYSYIINKRLANNEQFDIDYIGAYTCKSGAFILDVNTDPNVVSNKCSVIRFSIALLRELNESIFNDDILDTSVSFNVGIDKKCILDSTDYICGSITNVYGYTGALESKFDIIKVTKDADGTIVIYEKGYLVDNRSNVNNPNDQYDNYYLHSSDSKDYYYELKSADNLTFKHTFKTVDNENYYYLSTELVKE